MSKRSIIIIAVVLIGVVIAIISFAGKKKPVYTTADVVKGEVVQTVSATGTVEAAKKLNLQFVNSGKIAEINVKVGDSVKKDAVLAKLDTAQLDSQLRKAQASLNAARANLDKLLQGATTEDIKVSQTAVNNAQIALDNAKKSLADTKEGATKDIASAQASVDNTQVTLDNAKQSLENTKSSNENSLNEDYDSAWNTINSSLLTASNSLNTNNYTLGFEDAKNTLSILNSQYLYDSSQSKLVALNSYNTAKDYVDGVKTAPSHGQIDTALAKTKDALEDIRDTLFDTNNVLQATVTSSSLSLTELDTLKSGISTARTNINTAVTDVTDAQQDITTQIVTNQTSQDSAQATVNSAQSALNVAQNNYSATVATSATKINTSENAVKTAEGALQQAQDTLALKVAKPRSTEVALSQSQVQESQASADLIVSQINDSTLVAPQDGIITEVNGEVGEIASAAKIFIAMITSENFEIKANVSEVDIAKVKAKDQVEITFDALGSDRKFIGEVTGIDPAETEVSGVIYYKVTTMFTGDSAIVKPGMTANLDILTAKKENVVNIPFQALKEEGGKKYVQILKNGNVENIDVTVGLKGDSNVEITRGLSGGEKVITFMQ